MLIMTASVAAYALREAKPSISRQDGSATWPKTPLASPATPPAAA
jgi:hypothetical protein